MSHSTESHRSTFHCPRCGRLISYHARSCLYCKLPRPSLFANLPLLRELMHGDMRLGEGIFITCIALYFTAILLDIGGSLNSSGLFGLLAPSSGSLYRLGMGGAIPWNLGRWWTLVTATYLHGGLLHIVFNLMWLRSIGPLVEELFGRSRFFIIYTLAGVGGVALSTLMGTPFTVGASGSIFGLLAALIYYGRIRGGTFGAGIMRTMLIYAGIGLVLGFLAPNVDNWGHVGGLLIGFAAAAVLGYEERAKQSLTHHLVASGFLLFVLVAFTIMVVLFFTSPPLPAA
ncbi:MAG TPA: rhomboid family intramembrane serine protease [Anaerolineales bacterium]|nr:rhomboid family intramembrane serine protease [Anaerolineales bacterium]